jgi:hypothetical protein
MHNRAHWHERRRPDAVPDDFPFTPPIFTFTTKIHHPGVLAPEGKICLAELLLKENGGTWCVVHVERWGVGGLNLFTAKQGPLEDDPGHPRLHRRNAGVSTLTAGPQRKCMFFRFFSPAMLHRFHAATPSRFSDMH